MSAETGTAPAYTGNLTARHRLGRKHENYENMRIIEMGRDQLNRRERQKLKAGFKRQILSEVESKVRTVSGAQASVRSRAA